MTAPPSTAAFAASFSSSAGRRGRPSGGPRRRRRCRSSTFGGLSEGLRTSPWSRIGEEALPVESRAAASPGVGDPALRLHADVVVEPALEARRAGHRGGRTASQVSTSRSWRTAPFWIRNLRLEVVEHELPRQPDRTGRSRRGSRSPTRRVRGESEISPRARERRLRGLPGVAAARRRRACIRRSARHGHADAREDRDRARDRGLHLLRDLHALERRWRCAFHSGTSGAEVDRRVELRRPAVQVRRVAFFVFAMPPSSTASTSTFSRSNISVLSRSSLRSNVAREASGFAPFHERELARSRAATPAPEPWTEGATNARIGARLRHLDVRLEVERRRLARLDRDGAGQRRPGPVAVRFFTSTAPARRS